MDRHLLTANVDAISTAKRTNKMLLTRECHELTVHVVYIVPAGFQAKLEIVPYWRRLLNGWLNHHRDFAHFLQTCTALLGKHFRENRKLSERMKNKY